MVNAQLFRRHPPPDRLYIVINHTLYDVRGACIPKAWRLSRFRGGRRFAAEDYDTAVQAAAHPAPARWWAAILSAILPMNDDEVRSKLRGLSSITEHIYSLRPVWELANDKESTNDNRSDQREQFRVTAERLARRTGDRAG